MLFPEPEIVQKIKKIHEKARFLRGRFLNFVAVIEHDMAAIITTYFCQDESKQELFFECIASNMSLQQKKKILSDIVKSEHTQYHNTNKDVFSSIQQIQEFRNKLAHSMVDVSNQARTRPMEEGIGFIQWRKGEPITEDMFNDWEIKVTKVNSMLEEIKRLLN